MQIEEQQLTIQISNTHNFLDKSDYEWKSGSDPVAYNESDELNVYIEYKF